MISRLARNTIGAALLATGVIIGIVANRWVTTRGGELAETWADIFDGWS